MVAGLDLGVMHWEASGKPRGGRVGLWFDEHASSLGLHSLFSSQLSVGIMTVKAKASGSFTLPHGQLQQSRACGRGAGSIPLGFVFTHLCKSELSELMV